MSAESPLVIPLTGFTDQQYRKFLNNDDARKTATHVVFQFRVKRGTANSNYRNGGIVLKESSLDDGVLNSRNDIISWMGTISSKLPAAIHVQINFVDWEDHSTPSAVLRAFPVEIFGALFQQYRLSLISFKISGGSVVLLTGSSLEFQSAMKHLSCMQRLKFFVTEGFFGVFGSIEADGTVQPHFQNRAQQFGKALLGLKSLKGLSIPGACGGRSALELMQIIEQGNRILFLHLAFPHGAPYMSPSEEAATPAHLFQETIEKMTSLIKLRLWIYPEDPQNPGSYGTDVVHSVLRAIACNQSLRTISIYLLNWNALPQESYFDAFQKDLDEVIQTNLTLSKIKIKVISEGRILSLPRSEPSKFWLKMNGVGRRQALLQDTQNTKRWISVLLDQKDDHQIIFFLLSTNLSMYLPFLLGQESSTSNKPVEQRKSTSMSSSRPHKKPKLNH